MITVRSSRNPASFAALLVPFVAVCNNKPVSLRISEHPLTTRWEILIKNIPETRSFTTEVQYFLQVI